MTQGLKVWASDGSTVVFDSTTVVAGVCIGLYTYTPGQTDTKTFPELSGRTITLRNVYGSSNADFPSGVNVDYVLGYPRLNVSGVTFTITVSLWAQ
jgi:hypothetical protein